MARWRSALRTGALLALGAFAVHQLRYPASYGDGAGAALGAQGHGYLETVLPFLVAIAVAVTLGTCALAVFARRRDLGRGRAGWAFCTAALLAIFFVQESAEGLLSEGHPSAIAALTGHNGWIVFPIAAVIGRVVAWLVRGLTSIERTLAAAVLPRRSRHSSDRALPPEAPGPVVRPSPLAFGLARRPPPVRVA
jgi:hypothetical protein